MKSLRSLRSIRSELHFPSSREDEHNKDNRNVAAVFRRSEGIIGI